MQGQGEVLNKWVWSLLLKMVGHSAVQCLEVDRRSSIDSLEGVVTFFILFFFTFYGNILRQ